MKAADADADADADVCRGSGDHASSGRIAKNMGNSKGRLYACTVIHSNLKSDWTQPNPVTIVHSHQTPLSLDWGCGVGFYITVRALVYVEK